MSCKLAFSYLFTIRSAQLPPEKCDENTTFFHHRPHKKVVREEDCRPPPIAASDDDDDRAASSPPFVLVVLVLVFVFVVFIFFFVVSASPSPRPCLAKRYGTSSFDDDRRFVALARAGGGTLPPPSPPFSSRSSPGLADRLPACHRRRMMNDRGKIAGGGGEVALGAPCHFVRTTPSPPTGPASRFRGIRPSSECGEDERR